MFEEYGDMLSVEEVMDILGIGRNAAYDLFKSGDLKCFRFKGKWKIPKQSVIEFITRKSGLA